MQRATAHTIDFQHASGLNKAVLDIIGMDVPMIAVAKNNLERKERAFQQLLVFIFFFMLAPIHATLLAKLFGRNLPDPHLMRVPFDALKNTQAMQKYLKPMYQNTLGLAMPKSVANRLVGPKAEALRKQILQAKTRLIGSDLVVESLLASSIGPIKVLFGRWLSGQKDQFTGEIGLVDQEKLDKIYQEEAQHKRLSKHVKTALPMLGGLALVGLSTLLIRRGMRAPFVKVSKDVGVIKKLGFQLGKVLDYRYLDASKKLKQVPFISDGGLILLTIPQTAGYLAAARSPREFKELLVQRSMMECSFFFALPVLMKVMSAGLMGRYGIRSGTSIHKILAKSRVPKRLLPKAKGHLARLFWMGFAGNTAILAWVIHLANEMTRKSLKDKAQALPNGTVG